MNTKSDFINKLRELNIAEDDFVTLSYSEGAEVWHVNDDYIDWSAENTETCSMLGDLLASGVTISHHSGQGDILVEMRIAADANDSGRLENFSADQFIKGFNVSVKTPDGTLTLN